MPLVPDGYRMKMPGDEARPAVAKDIFVSSLLARPAWSRLAGVTVLLVALWLLIGWAVSLP